MRDFTILFLCFGVGFMLAGPFSKWRYQGTLGQWADRFFDAMFVFGVVCLAVGLVLALATLVV